jgi:hypothetical protein
LIANHFDPNGFPPSKIVAVLGTKEIVLEKIAGRDGNATYQATTDDPGECTTLYFLAGSTTFPTTGALLAGSGCTKSFQADDPPRGDDRPIIDADDGGGGCACVARGPAPSLAFFPLIAVFLFVLVFARKMS